MQHIVRRAGSSNWYYRESIPDDIRAILTAQGQRSPKEIWRSLATPDLKRAKLEKVAVQAAQHKSWNDLRANSTVDLSEVPTIAEMADQAFERVYARFIAVHRRKLRDQFAENADVQSELQRRKDAIALSAFLPSPGNNEAMEKIASAICRHQGWKLRSDTPEGVGLWAELVHLVTQAVQLSRAAIVGELEGQASIGSREQVIRRLGVEPVQKADTGASLTELFERYSAAMLKRRDRNEDTLSADRKVIAQFAEFVGADRDPGSISKSEAREFRNALSNVPVKWTSRNDLRGLSLRKAASQWERIGGAVRNEKTVAKEWSGLSSFYSWLVREGYAEANPTRDLAPKVDRRTGKLPTYSMTQLVSLLSTPLFAGCLSTTGQEHLPGKCRIDDWRFWLPLCALYSGARAAEIAQLECGDLRCEEGVWVFDFNESEIEAPTRSKKLKTASSKRIVPIHSALIGFGLLRYADRMESSATKRLFPEIVPCSRGALSTQPSKFWQRYLKRVGMKERGLAIHSFRHTFADECRKNGVSDSLLGSILGHSKGTITAHYGTSVEGNLAQRCSAIEAVSYESLHLHPSLLAREGKEKVC